MFNRRLFIKFNIGDIMKLTAILITLLSGISFLIGYIITKFVKNEKKLVTFSVGFSFTIILGLVFFDLLPECLELLESRLLIIICVLVGISVLKLLDIFIPNHEHEGNKKNHMEHIGLISALALFLHNIIEGTAIYTTSTNSLSLGFFTALGVSFHNIPLGIQISSLIKDKQEKTFLLSSLVFSSVIGIIIINIFKITLNNTLTGVLISLTLGMLTYISMFELLCEVKEHIKKKELQIGIILGIIIILIGHFIH